MAADLKADVMCSMARASVRVRVDEETRTRDQSLEVILKPVSALAI